MQLKGFIIEILPIVEGKKPDGSLWQKQDFILEYTNNSGRYKKACLSISGAERIARFDLKVGMEIEASFDIYAHEWNGRWFNSTFVYDVNILSKPNIPEAGNGVYYTDDIPMKGNLL